jgi:hypothetical protein
MFGKLIGSQSLGDDARSAGEKDSGHKQPGRYEDAALI